MYGPDYANDLAGFYRRTRSACGPVAPVLLVGDVPAWLVTSYQDVLYISRNPQIFGRDSNHWNLWDQIPDDWPLMFPVIRMPMVLHLEGEEHARRAGAISDVLETLDLVDVTRMCEHTADQLIDSFAADGQADLIAQYAQQLGCLVLARLLGVREEQVPSMVADFIAASTARPDNLTAGMGALAAVTQHVSEQRKEPGSGLTAKLIRHPAALTDEELAMDMAIVFACGGLPTANWIGSALRLMLIDDDFSLNLQGGRISVDQALNEVLWEDPPFHNLVGCWPLRDVELGGHRIPKGDFICVSLAGANADARLRLEPGLSANRAHLAFGHGQISCPAGGPDLAETIAKRGVEVLLDRLPDARLSVPPADLRWNESYWLRSLQSLPVTFTPIAPLRRPGDLPGL